MFWNFIRTSSRHLMRDKTYVIANIAGLSLGIAAALILGGYLFSELTYDRHNVNHNRIFRVATEVRNQSTDELFAESSYALGPLLAREYPEFSEFVRFRSLPSSPSMIVSDDTKLYWDNIFFADASVFNIFTHDIVSGDPETALESPSSVVVSETFAKAYFGDESAIGRTIETDLFVLQVTLVFKDIPENSHLKYDALISYNALGMAADDSSRITEALWDLGPYTYFQLPQGYDAGRFDAVSTDIWNRFMADRGRELSTNVRFMLEPLTSIHLRSQTSGSSARVYLLYVYFLISIAIFSLMVGVINYVNMATANSVKRANEIGVRKILGASKASLQLQFLVESVFFSYCALIVGALIAWAVINFTPMTSLLGTSMSMADYLNPATLTVIALATLLLGIMAGSYPAFYLSALSSASIFGKGDGGGQPPNSAITRLVLIIVQLTVSVGIVACSIFMFTQMAYIEDQDLGFDIENIVVVPLRGADVIERLPEINDALANNPAFFGAGISRSLPGEQSELYFFDAELESGAPESRVFRLISVGGSYLDLMGIELLGGRGLETMGADRAANSILVNEAAVRQLGWQNPLGKVIQRGQASYEVVGVVEDFNFLDLSREIEPLLIFHDQPDFTGPQWDAVSRAIEYRYLSVSLADSSDGSIDALQQVFGEVDPEHPFEFFYLSEYWDDLYGSQTRQLGLMAIFSLLCIFIAGIGLFGISAFLTKLRTKEIGIRQILGASSIHLFVLTFKGIFIAAVAASVIASIITFFVFVNWQDSFSVSYRVPINGFVFIVSSAVCISIAFLTVLLQFYRTVKKNPVFWSNGTGHFNKRQYLSVIEVSLWIKNVRTKHIPISSKMKRWPLFGNKDTQCLKPLKHWA